ncbi:hypothetical protein GCM10008939_21340 [Deinococcus aquiradiocola]|uniref:PqqD family protein n=1 Tax=Deinococcus aquiradiocola TaxID=393059 RepID=A0A917PGT6_9DEIO|nr:hypothetical protein GCM10008939_21340 [Deinococcus aquiradiocola]
MWNIHPDVLVTDLDDELVLLHPLRSEMFSLNAAGGVIWRALPGTAEALVAALTDAFDVTTAEAEADVDALLRELAARDLVRRS